MASPTPKSEYDPRITREDCDNYFNTVLVALALINIVRWDEGKREIDSSVNFGLGRKMATSAKNLVSPSTDVTPDVVLQRNNQGLVAEITYSLAADDKPWLAKLGQVLKYDDTLVGWWTATEKLSAAHDIILLVPQSRMVRVADIVLEQKAKAKAKVPGAIKFKRSLCVVGFHRETGAEKERIHLMKFHGELADADLSKRLREGILVAHDILVVVYRDRKFVDFEPPMPYVLQMLWDYVFSTYTAEFPVTAANKGKIPITVDLDRLSEDMQNNYGFKAQDSRSNAVPARAWIKKAMDHLVVFKMASKVDEKKYTVQYRSIRGDHIEYFGRLIFKNKGNLALSGTPTTQYTLALVPPAEPPPPTDVTE